jgi:hypothetical protein
MFPRAFLEGVEAEGPSLCRHRPQVAQSMARIKTVLALSHSRLRRTRLDLHSSRANESHAAYSAHPSRRTRRGANRGVFAGGKKDRAVVVNVTVALVAFEPSSATEGGEIVQVAAVGALVQRQVTV